MQDYLGPEIISHFVMHGTNVAEIVKHLITVLRKKDDDISNIFLEAMKRVEFYLLPFNMLIYMSHLFAYFIYIIKVTTLQN